jgi:predicted ATPase/DNA-binding winged helix-turn-helix (wHTH) protein
MQFRFGHHTLDLDTVELRYEGRPVELEPRSFAVLAHLVENRHRVVPKHELLDTVWGDRFVSDSALATRIKHCRKAVGDDGEAQRVIKTVHRVGYRFVAPVEPTTSRPPVEVSPAWAAAPSGTLFGRDPDMAAVAERLAGHRLVTVTGPGGVGKSRLCAELVESGLLGATGTRWVCDLTTTRDPATVADVVLVAVGEGQQSDADPIGTLGRVLDGRRGLLLLDNCEHLVDAVRPLVEELTASLPDLRILATSRIPLDVSGESVVVLEPLGHDAAVACFVARARDAGARVDADDPAVGELCERLDRMPLALELAAARARSLGPRQMIELLDDRFRLLRRAATTPHGEPHHSLHETIAWSWEHLDPADQQLLAQLSVFVGSFSLDDAAGVTMPGADTLDVVDGLDRLVRTSMLVAVPAGGGTRRFRLLDSIRDFAAERLADPPATRDRHAEHYAELVESLDSQLLTDRVDPPLAAIAASWANIRAAVDHAGDARDLATIRRIVRAVGAYADLYQSYEVIDWCAQAALVAPDGTLATDAEPDLVADAVAVWARLLAHRGDHARAAELADAAHRAHPSFVTQLSKVWIAYYQGELDQVIEGAEHLVASSRSDRGVDRAYADGFCAIVAAVRQVPELGTTDVSATEAESGLLGTLRCLTAGFRLCAADPARAAELLEAVVTTSLRRDYRLLLGAAASTLTQITLPGRPPEEAMQTLCRTLTRYRERNMWTLISADTVMAATLLADAGEVEVACRLLGARNASGYRVGLSEVGRAMLHDRLEHHLGRELFEQLLAEGASWPPPRAGEVAVTAMQRHLGQHG